MQAVLALDPAPAAVLLSGDVANEPAPGVYELARELLAPLPMPVHVLPGNHDDRAMLRAAFELPGQAGERVRYTARCGGLRLLVCDTTRPGHEDGELDGEHRAWLEAQLASEPETPTVLAMHHPPLQTGIDALDAIGIPAGDRAELGELLARWPQVRRVVAGHVHRAAFDVLGGCGVFTCASTWAQARLEIGGTEIVLATEEPAAIALHVALGERFVTHVLAIPSSGKGGDGAG